MEYLFHYTSIEDLALILKYRAIRLNSLAQMDDLQENITEDVKDIGRFVFASSWTAEDRESIPMWAMYSDPGAGVRIKLRRNPFVHHGTKLRDLADIPGIKIPEDTDLDGEIPSFLDLAQLMKRGCFSVQAIDGEILEEIIYTDDMDKLEPRVSIVDSAGKVAIRLSPVGKYKSTYWAFQREYRYVMNFMSMNFNVEPQEISELFNQSVNRLLEGKEEPPFRHYYLDIDQSAFEEMEITRSPKLTYGNRLLLDALVEKYNPNAVLLDSALQGKV